jgi:CHC2 zinc finger
VTLTFEAWHAETPDLPGWARAEAFRFLPAEDQGACWEHLNERCRLWGESEYLLEQRGYEEWPLPKRHQPRQRSSAATSTHSGTVVLSSDDPLKSIEPRVYVEALTGETVPPNGWLRCPLPDHEDTTPSFQVLHSHWRCFGCGRGGGVIDLASALHGIEPRGSGYWRLRDLILERLLWAPIHPED